MKTYTFFCCHTGILRHALQCLRCQEPSNGQCHVVVLCFKNIGLHGYFLHHYGQKMEAIVLPSCVPSFDHLLCTLFEFYTYHHVLNV